MFLIYFALSIIVLEEGYVSSHLNVLKNVYHQDGREQLRTCVTTLDNLADVPMFSLVIKIEDIT